MKHLWGILLILASCSPLRDGEQVADDWAPISVECLPDMGIPRAGHQLLWTGDALVAIGGHTTGFVITRTAEAYKDGRWQPIQPPLYPHDGGFALPLRDGGVLLGGGCSQDFGIGGTWGLERFDPVTCTFSGVGIMDRPRSFASALERQDGDIVVSGNWFAPDAIAVLDTPTLGTAAAHFESRDLSVSGPRPFLFETSDGNVLVLGVGVDARNEPAPIVVNRLNGEPLELPLFEEWRPLYGSFGNAQTCRIGPYDYLLAVQRRDSSAVAVLRVQDGQFSPLETSRPVSVLGPEGTSCRWVFLYTDVSLRVAWLTGRDAEGRLCLARIDYNPVFDGGKAGVSLYATAEPVPGMPIDEWTMAVLPGGSLAMVGGKVLPEGGNFAPSASAWVFHTRPPVHAGMPWWPFALSALILGVIGFRLLRRRRPAPAITPEQEEAGFQDVMTRLQRLMEEKQLFRQPDLRVEDVAREVGMSVAYVRGCIAGIYGDSFKNYVNEYRVRYVQQQMLAHPGAKINVLAEEAGFSSPATFYRVFAAVTGQSPTAWLEHNRL